MLCPDSYQPVVLVLLALPAWVCVVLQVADFGLSKQKQQTYVSGEFWGVGTACCTKAAGRRQHFKCSLDCQVWGTAENAPPLSATSLQALPVSDCFLLCSCCDGRTELHCVGTAATPLGAQMLQALPACVARCPGLPLRSSRHPAAAQRQW